MERFDTIATAILVICALAVTASVLRETFFPRPFSSTEDPVAVPNWDELEREAFWLEGDTSADVSLLAFTDLECPACRGFHNEVVPAIKEEFSGRVRLGYLHWPLDYHRFAEPAARAFECAAAVSRGHEWLDIVFQKQDSLGLKSWGSYAAEGGISDSERIEACALGRTEFDQFGTIERERGLAEAAGLSGTPAILIDGWYYPGTSSYQALRTILRGKLEG